MPELPEVTIMVNDLKKKVLNRTIVKAWTDTKKLFKNVSFSEFEKAVKGRKIKDVFRRGKIICFRLDNNKILFDHSSIKRRVEEEIYLFIHPKISGHFLITRDENKIKEENFVRLIFWLRDERSAPIFTRRAPGARVDNDLMLAFSDLRKFARIELWDKTKLSQAKIIQELGQDALELTLIQFEEILKKSRKKIKQTLMEQNLIAGIGNIYADEILFQGRVHPFKTANSLTKQEINKIYRAIKPILEKAIKLGGSSVSDFRNSEGGKGRFQNEFKVYHRHGQKCLICKTIIKRQKIASRSTHFCPKCQK